MGKTITPNILGFGEAMVERSTAGQSYAGDIINCLKAAELAGSHAFFCSQVGNDNEGHELLAFLNQQNIDTTFCNMVDGKTGSYTISNTQDGERTFTYNRAGSAASKIEPSDIPEDIFKGIDLFYLSGISLAISSSSAETALKLLDLAKDQDVKIAYDINFRSTLIEENRAAAIYFRILPFLDFCFLSAEDLPLACTALGLERKALTSEFLSLVSGNSECETVVKLGSSGSQLIDEEGNLHHLHVRPVNAIDTSGAGDVFNGVYLANRLKGVSRTEAQQSATEFASQHVTRCGAFPK